MARVTGLGGIFFKARDRAMLGKWYREHLGIPVEDQGWAVFEWRERARPERVGSTVWSLFPAETAYFPAPCMINYRVDDLDRALAELAAEGVSVDDKRHEDANGRFAWITDPEGNRIELWEPAAGS